MIGGLADWFSLLFRKRKRRWRCLTLDFGSSGWTTSLKPGLLREILWWVGIAITKSVLESKSIPVETTEEPKVVLRREENQRKHQSNSLETVSKMIPLGTSSASCRLSGCGQFGLNSGEIVEYPLVSHEDSIGYQVFLNPR
jgi:hypothetical protein